LAPNKFDFLLVIMINSSVAPIMPRFKNTAGFPLKTATPTLFQIKFGNVPLGLCGRHCVSEERKHTVTTHLV